MSDIAKIKTEFAKAAKNGIITKAEATQLQTLADLPEEHEVLRNLFKDEIVRRSTATPPTTLTAPDSFKVFLKGNDPVVTSVDRGPLHSTAPVTFEWIGGNFKFTKQALQRWNMTDAKSWGISTVKAQTPWGERTVLVRDLHYTLGGGKVGARFVPVSDNGDMQLPDGTTVGGSEIMDGYLRKEMGLGPDDPIWTLIAYQHPEDNGGVAISDLAVRTLKTELSETHMGGYLGKGRTFNAPESYHMREWEVGGGYAGYPATVQVVTLKGESQRELNRNAHLCAPVLNKGVVFPGDYKNDVFRTADINTTLMFYRDWLRDESYLRNDNEWATYCAEHQTIVANVALNVPHNEASFKEIFGADGSALWTAFKSKYQAASGKDFTADMETHFEPLWKKEKIGGRAVTPADIRPWTTPAEYDKYQAARLAGRVRDGSYTGFKPLAPGVAMAWPPETTSNLLENFVETYAGFPDVGGVVTSSVIMGFRPNVMDRIKISEAQFMAAAIPAMQTVMVADAMANAGSDHGTYVAKITDALYIAFGGKEEDFQPGGTVNAQLMGLAKTAMEGAQKYLDGQMAGVAVKARTVDEAYAWLREALQGQIKAARETAITSANAIEYNSPPAVSHRVAAGVHDGNPLVSIREVATAIDSSMIEKAP